MGGNFYDLWREKKKSVAMPQKCMSNSDSSTLSVAIDYGTVSFIQIGDYAREVFPWISGKVGTDVNQRLRSVS